MSTPENQSYLAAGINKLSPWGPRSPASKPVQSADGDITSVGLGLKQQRGGDHSIGHRRGLSLRNYPRDCPPLTVQWFFAVDVPKRKPDLAGQPPSKTEKARVAPKKYSAFSNHDSRAIETAFQKLNKGEDASDKRKSMNDGDLGHAQKQDQGHISGDLGTVPVHTSESVKVPVNEDFLFDVDIGRRELGPAYWLGPVYDIRRGSWFHQGQYLYLGSFVVAHHCLQIAACKNHVMRILPCSSRKAFLSLRRGDSQSPDNSVHRLSHGL